MEVGKRLKQDGNDVLVNLAVGRVNLLHCWALETLGYTWYTLKTLPATVYCIQIDRTCGNDTNSICLVDLAVFEGLPFPIFEL